MERNEENVKRQLKMVRVNFISLFFRNSNLNAAHATA
jgi:hypothetical protein